MTKQLFSEGLLKMAGVPLDEEMDSMENTLKKESEQEDSSSEYKKIEDLIRQTGGHIERLDLYESKLTKLPEGIISVKLFLAPYSKLTHLPSSLKKVEELWLIESAIKEIPVLEGIEFLAVHGCEDLKSIPSLPSLIDLNFADSGVEQIGEYPKLAFLQGGNSPLCTRIVQDEFGSEESEGMEKELLEYFVEHNKIPTICTVDNSSYYEEIWNMYPDAED